MIRYIFFILLSFTTINSNAQVIALYDKLMQKVNDTTITLQYFKNADSVLLNKIDSFDIFLNQRKYELDSNYFYELKFEVRQCKKRIIIRYNSQYVDYIMVAKMSEQKQRYGDRMPFAFFFYKNKLIMCSILRNGLHLSKDAEDFVTNLIYEHVDESEKKLILGYPQDSYKVLTKPVKGYFLDY
jgi:hypothetical protein